MESTDSTTWRAVNTKTVNSTSKLGLGGAGELHHNAVLIRVKNRHWEA